MSPEVAQGVHLTGSYSPLLVVLSVMVAVLASYVALALAERLTAAPHRFRSAWLAGGSLAMGIGIWAMHFVGMLAFRLPVPMAYDAPLLLLSVVVAIGASALALAIVSRPVVRAWHLAAGGMSMGVAIAGMHYLGMAGLRTAAHVRYHPGLVAASVTVAVGASLAALVLAVRFRGDSSALAIGPRRAAAVVMGVAIAGMHYIAMAAARFIPDGPDVVLDGALLVATPALAASVVAASITILGLALVGTVADRYFRAQFEVRASEERYRLLIEAVEDYAIFTLDPHGAVQSWNVGAERLLGYTEAEILGRSGAVIFTPEDQELEAPEREIAQASTTGRAEDERWHQRKDGSRFWASGTLTALRDDRGALRGFVKIMRDNTARKRAEEAMRTWSDAFHHAAHGLVISDPASGTLRLANPAFAAMHGYTVEEVVGLPITALYPPEVRAEIGDIGARADEAGHYVFESVHLRKDGTTFPVLMDVTSVRDGTGRVRYRIANVQDITERQNLAQQLQQAQRLEAVGQLAGGVAHDFNNILTAVEGYSDFLLKQLTPDDPRRQDVLGIKHASERAATLTQQLLAFSRRQVIQPRPVQLNEVVEESTKLLLRLLGTHVRLELVLSPELGLVLADRGQLDQVLVNLAVNARDAMPDGGALTIETSRVTVDRVYAGQHLGVEPGEYVELAVTDTGHGMDPLTKARIFEPFFTTKERGKGTGLGLATVFGIVKQAGGSIFVYSEPGQGATFKILLPVVQSVGESRPAEQPMPADVRGTETILLVEDDPTIRQLARRALAYYGYTVLEASGAGDAVLLSEQHREPIHLLLTDVMMPRMTGRQLADRLLGLHPEVRVLYMSGYTDNVIVRQGVLKPGVAFLPKPFTPDSLARKVRQVLDSAEDVGSNLHG